jgi:hypothetical protein
MLYAGFICMGASDFMFYSAFTIYILKFWIVAVKVDHLNQGKTIQDCRFEVVTCSLLALILLQAVLFTVLIAN